MGIGRKPIPFWDRVNKTDACWLWTGAIWGNNHYGCVRINGRTQSAHRVAWQLSNGEIPHGMNVLHHCDIPLCVRPDHLFLGTQKHNAIDASSKGRQTNQYRGKTHCKRGHEFTHENTRYDGHGRQCRICDALRPSRLKAKHERI